MEGEMVASVAFEAPKAEIEAPLPHAAQALLRELKAYFAGTLQCFATPVKFSGTSFEVAVYKAIASIPYGETRSYSEVAKAVGRPRSARAVGNAAGKNPTPILVPCHRVIGTDGSLSGYSGGKQIKEFLLRLEQRHTKLQTDKCYRGK
jgi:O-6-methylguanine DNA methyltransferase